AMDVRNAEGLQEQSLPCSRVRQAEFGYFQRVLSLNSMTIRLKSAPKQLKPDVSW
ncbi:MAG: hypothetical protein ACI9BW_002023, partial [Gammaproteobacteria bacterium]